eukprot:m.33287 g.33287  ORF g.33287 m.33287 type:complete len:75 (-) comp7177_c0_seq1:259-483(-)
MRSYCSVLFSVRGTNERDARVLLRALHPAHTAFSRPFCSNNAHPGGGKCVVSDRGLKEPDGNRKGVLETRTTPR